jgi:hypothetical protein
MYTALTRPFALFIREPIAQVMGAYLAFVYGTLYRERMEISSLFADLTAIVFLTIIPRTFRGVYGQSLGIAGLNYIALGIGVVFASQINANTSNPIYKYLKARYGGVGKPEYRLRELLKSRASSVQANLSSSNHRTCLYSVPYRYLAHRLGSREESILVRSRLGKQMYNLLW